MKVFSGIDGALLHQFFAFDSSMIRGVYIAAGDVDVDGTPDIIASTCAGIATEVRVFSGINLNGAPIRRFDPYPTYPVGVTVAAGDFDGDGRSDIVTGAEDGNPHVKVFSGLNPSAPLLKSFFPYDPQYAVGAFVTVGDFNGDGTPDIITAPVNRIAPGGPHVKVISGISRALLREFFAFDAGFTGGVRVGAVDMDGDGRVELFTGSGPGMAARMRGWRGGNANRYLDIPAFDFNGGLYVG